MKIQELSPLKVTEATDLIARNLGAFEDVGSVLASAFRRTKNILQTYSTPGSAYFVMLDEAAGGLVVGGVGIGPLAGLSREEGIGEIREVVIDERYRRQGLGRKLLTHAMAQAEKMGYHRVYLETTPQMLQAQKLFGSFGFRLIKEAGQKQQLLPEANQLHLPCYYLFERKAGRLAPKSEEVFPPAASDELKESAKDQSI